MKAKVYLQMKWLDYLENLSKNYPIYSIEDGMSEDDWDGWTKLTEKIGDKITIVGDDLFVTNIKRLKTGIEKMLQMQF